MPSMTIVDGINLLKHRQFGLGRIVKLDMSQQFFCKAAISSGEGCDATLATITLEWATWPMAQDPAMHWMISMSRSACRGARPGGVVCFDIVSCPLFRPVITTCSC